MIFGMVSYQPWRKREVKVLMCLKMLNLEKKSKFLKKWFIIVVRMVPLPSYFYFVSVDIEVKECQRKKCSFLLKRSEHSAKEHFFKGHPV